MVVVTVADRSRQPGGPTRPNLPTDSSPDTVGHARSGRPPDGRRPAGRGRQRWA